MHAIEVDAFAALTLGIVVYFIGKHLTGRVSLLRDFSIPEPVSGGLLVALCVLVIVVLSGREVSFNLAARDALLVYFFTTVGLNARLSDLIKGGPLLGIMLALTVVAMLFQNGVGTLAAVLWGLPAQAGVMLGTASLIGGHGTAIAWGPVVQDQYGVAGAAELGIATATLGLIAASLLGGPIARYLITKNQLTADTADAQSAAGAETDEATADDPITNDGVLRSLLWLHVAIAVGYSGHEALQAAGVMLPLFVPCLLAGILISNSVPRIFTRLAWPAHTASLALIQEISLSVFLAMSLMSMQLWTLGSSAGVLVTALLLQTLFATLFIVFVLFKVMGSNYFAAVLSAGFAGFSLGATPTAIANMTAVTQKYGPSPLAFIILPLISAFFVDLANAVLIQWFISL
ncbi:ESS family glutamate:Na+ symporter [Roseibium hamelinense]|uniref:Sodium/glutamate symporter n=1 Tax=Roseibium hamelinense TaxID=150831 RepID=A0A562TAZ6_9HYPH|nr:sodium/glutamate symporter [Roseibium hamelinense]MTI45203.1 sodium/glutamate symporter [Roseibium hamelinense]TWI90434.1 ESS family glutamate:Na+ symporter [Roseibium hamelinense]